MQAPSRILVIRCTLRTYSNKLSFKRSQLPFFSPLGEMFFPVYRHTFFICGPLCMLRVPRAARWYPFPPSVFSSSSPCLLRAPLIPFHLLCESAGEITCVVSPLWNLKVFHLSFDEQAPFIFPHCFLLSHYPLSLCLVHASVMARVMTWFSFVLLLLFCSATQNFTSPLVILVHLSFKGSVFPGIHWTREQK